MTVIPDNVDGRTPLHGDTGHPPGTGPSQILDKILAWPSDRLEELVMVVTGKNPKVLDTNFDDQVRALEPKEIRY